MRDADRDTDEGARKRSVNGSAGWRFKRGTEAQRMLDEEREQERKERRLRKRLRANGEPPAEQPARIDGAARARRLGLFNPLRSRARMFARAGLTQRESVAALLEYLDERPDRGLGLVTVMEAGREIPYGVDRATVEALAEEAAAKFDGAPAAPSEIADYDRLAFTGALLREVAERPEPTSPLPGILDPEPGLHGLYGRSKVGKTTFALQLALCFACGVSPWRGVQALPGSRALFLSREQRLSRIVRRANAIARACEIGDRWVHRVAIVARDRDLPRELRPLLTLDDGGIEHLDRWLGQARELGDPIGMLVIDSATRMRPSAAETNSNDHMTAWLDRLHDLAERHDCYVILIHHQGHGEREGGRGAGRGASAFDDVPQAVMEIKRLPNERAYRQLRVYGNAVDDATYTFRVAPDDDPGKVLRWSPQSPDEAVLPERYIQLGETISAEELAWRVSGEKRPEPSLGADGKSKRIEPPSSAQQRARELREQWEAAALITVGKTGKRIDIQLASEAEPDF